MKFLILQADGMPDYPIDELGGRTPLEVAKTPNLDALAKKSIIGLTLTIPEGFPPGSDVGNLSILGYSPKLYYSGRAPLEAVSMGIDLRSTDVAYRCNLVTLKLNNAQFVMHDYSAGHITNEEARELILYLNKKLNYKDISFYPGVSYRHIMVWKNGILDYDCTPPHDITGKAIADYLPRGRNRFLEEIILSSIDILSDHPVNKNRVKNGKSPANAIWLWGQGRAVQLPSIKERYNMKGAVIAGVDLIKGIGKSAGLEVINVKGATGYLDTNYKGKGETAAKALDKHDLVFVHLEAPDEAGHNGDVKAKIKAIESFDKFLLGSALLGLEKIKEWTLIILSDHPTPCSVRTHVAEPVPFMVYGNNWKVNNASVSFTESYAKKTGIYIDRGWELLDNVITGKILKEKNFLLEK